MSDNINNFNAMESAFKNRTTSNNMDDLSAYNDNKEQEPKFVPPDNIPMNLGNDIDGTKTKPPIQPPVNSDNVVNEESQQFRFEEENYENEDGFIEPQRPGAINEFDQQLFPGGPMISEIESWKKQYGDIWVVDDLPDTEIPAYIYRDLNRYEYKSIMATPNTDPLMREEMICEQCVLYPYEYSYGIMSNHKAGIPTILAGHIMETSGFTKASMPKRL